MAKFIKIHRQEDLTYQPAETSTPHRVVVKTLSHDRYESLIQEQWLYTLQVTKIRTLVQSRRQ